MRIKWGDILIILLTVALAGALFAGFPQNGGGLTAVIMQDGKEITRVNLTGLVKPVEIELEGAYHNHIIAENGRIRFDNSDCPDKTCVNTGWLTKTGQSAACLPNKALITIEGGCSGVDIITD